MTVQKRSIFAGSAIEPFHGDLGAEGATSPEPSTAGALGSESAHGDIANWHRNISLYGNVHECEGASGIGITGELPFRSAGYNGSESGSDTSGYGRGLAGEAPFSSHGYQDSDTGSDTSGYGKGIAGTDPFRRSNQI
jgi:hypothetical protein